MPLELSMLHRLVNKTENAILVGHLPQETWLHMAAVHGMIHFSSDSINHIRSKHPDIELIDMLIIPEMISNGLWIGDRKHNCCISYICPISGSRFIGAVKSADRGKEHFLTTFHKGGKRQTKSLLRRGPKLRNHL
jgi:hypothetical protein